MGRVPRQTVNFVLRAACRPGGVTEPDLWMLAGAVDAPHAERRQAMLRSALEELCDARLVERHGTVYEATGDGRTKRL